MFDTLSFRKIVNSNPSLMFVEMTQPYWFMTALAITSQVIFQSFVLFYSNFLSCQILNCPICHCFHRYWKCCFLLSEEISLKNFKRKSIWLKLLCCHPISVPLMRLLYELSLCYISRNNRNHNITSLFTWSRHTHLHIVVSNIVSQYYNILFTKKCANE